MRSVDILKPQRSRGKSVKIKPNDLEDKHRVADLIFYVKFKSDMVTKHAYKAKPLPALIHNAFSPFFHLLPFSPHYYPKIAEFLIPENMKGRFLFLSVLFCSTFHVSFSIIDGKLLIYNALYTNTSILLYIHLST